VASLVIVVSAVLVLSRGQTVGDPNNAQTLLSTASTIDAFKHLNRYASEEKKTRRSINIIYHAKN